MIDKNDLLQHADTILRELTAFVDARRQRGALGRAVATASVVPGIGWFAAGVGIGAATTFALAPEATSEVQKNARRWIGELEARIARLRGERPTESTTEEHDDASDDDAPIEAAPRPPRASRAPKKNGARKTESLAS